jgi:hypothetical protein
MTRGFEELDLDGHNYPTWAMNVKISLTLWGMYETIVPPHREDCTIARSIQVQCLINNKNHIHPNLKSGYVMEEEPSMLWAALQTRYEQHNIVILSEENHDWTHLSFQDYKSIKDYNHVIHKICARLCFCEKEPSEVDKIEKYFKLCSL